MLEVVSSLRQSLLVFANSTAPAPTPAPAAAPLTLAPVWTGMEPRGVPTSAGWPTSAHAAPPPPATPLATPLYNQPQHPVHPPPGNAAGMMGQPCTVGWGAGGGAGPGSSASPGGPPLSVMAPRGGPGDAKQQLVVSVSIQQAHAAGRRAEGTAASRRERTPARSADREPVGRVAGGSVTGDDSDSSSSDDLGSSCVMARASRLQATQQQLRLAPGKLQAQRGALGPQRR